MSIDIYTFQFFYVCIFTIIWYKDILILVLILVNIKPNTMSYDYTKCPYNKNHRFDCAKYFHHLGRCKEGQKVKHLYQTCRFNSLHIFLIK